MVPEYWCAYIQTDFEVSYLTAYVIQAGKFGLLQGAVRFDHTMGYKFSTYVQYWIRKSMSSSQAGLSMANIQAAKQCLRVVGSIDERFWDSFGAKFMEFTPDTSIESPEEILGRWCMVKEIHDLLKTLDLIERQVLVLRFGLGGHHRKSLQEIGTCFQVSEEWIRRVKQKALRKLRDEGARRYLSHFLYL